MAGLLAGTALHAGCSTDTGIKSVTDLAVEGKRVFVRVDYNVPLAKSDKPPRKVSDDARITATLPTLRHLSTTFCN